MSKRKSTTLFLILIAFSTFWSKKPLGVTLPQKSKPLHQIKKISETFRQLAQVLATGDLRLYGPSQQPNTHWRNWPEGGRL